MLVHQGEVWVSPKCSRPTLGVGRDGTSGLQVKLSAPAKGAWPDFHVYHKANLDMVKGHRYRASFWVRSSVGKNLVVAFYRPGNPFVYLGGPASHFENQIKLAADVDVDFVGFGIACPWPKPGEEPDWAGVDAVCLDVLGANPDALLLPRFGTEPPDWWKKEHPDDVMVWEDGPRPHGVEVSSPEYLRDASERVAALVRHLEETFGEHMAGYHPCGQNTGEWFYFDSWGQQLNGYSAGAERDFRRWLAATYADDAALRAAGAHTTAARRQSAVSYTHLTLPTIHSV